MCRNILFYIVPLLFIGFVSCQRDDDEPAVNPNKIISRLYVSTSDYEPGAATQVNNIWVIDSAASENSFAALTSYGSTVRGGRTIHFSPLNSGALFQAGINTPGLNDTAIHVLRISDAGVVSPSGRLANRKFDNVRGLFHTIVNSGINASSEFLLALNQGAGNQFGDLFVFLNPRNSGGFKVPNFRVPLNFVPWGMYIDEKDVLMVKTGNEGGLVVFNNMTNQFVEKTDSILSIAPSYTLTVTGSRNLRGMAYSKIKDLMVLTDYEGTGSAVGDGRILIFENFSSHVSNKNIVPTRVISGVATNLTRPMDIAVDPLEDGKYIYVADSQAKLVLRFEITDEGNVAPNKSLSLNGATPAGLSLDSRN